MQVIYECQIMHGDFLGQHHVVTAPLHGELPGLYWPHRAGLLALGKLEGGLGAWLLAQSACR